jgi:hypothetical protein
MACAVALHFADCLPGLAFSRQAFSIANSTTGT